LLIVLGVVACESDLTGSELGGQGALGRSSSGDVGDLALDQSIFGKEQTHQEVLEDSVGLGVREEL